MLYSAVLVKKDASTVVDMVILQDNVVAVAHLVETVVGVETTQTVAQERDTADTAEDMTAQAVTATRNGRKVRASTI